MTTANEATSGRVIVSTIEARPSDLQKLEAATSTSSVTAASSTAAFAFRTTTTSASVIIHLDGQNAIRRANEVLGGAQKVKVGVTTSS